MEIIAVSRHEPPESGQGENMKPITITELVAARIAAKRREEEAVEERRNLDEQIASLMRDSSKAESAISQKLDGYKITCTYGISRTVDKDKLQADWDKIPAAAQAAFRWKPEVAVSELKKLNGADAAVAAAYITAKPAAPQIKVEAC